MATTRAGKRYAELRYTVLPRRPPGMEAATEEALQAFVAGNGLIGTALV